MTMLPHTNRTDVAEQRIGETLILHDWNAENNARTVRLFQPSRHGFSCRPA